MCSFANPRERKAYAWPRLWRGPGCGPGLLRVRSISHRIGDAKVFPDRTEPAHRLIFAVDWPIERACAGDSRELRLVSFTSAVVGWLPAGTAGNPLPRP